MNLAAFNGIFAQRSELSAVARIARRCLHVWQIAPGKTCLTAKLHIARREEEAGEDMDLLAPPLHEDVLRGALSYCKYKYGLAHSTIQVAQDIHLL